MPNRRISYKETGYFSKLICDYIAEIPALKDFYNRLPTIENFELQIAEKQLSDESRKTLVKQLEKQYSMISVSDFSHQNIQSLSKPNTYTITTGHQLNLFTGPLYFLYKIFSVINLCEQLSSKYPKCNFVPVYWMATEDHDLDEINYFNLFGKKIRWDQKAGGAVGELDTKGLEIVRKQLKLELGDTDIAETLIQLFEKSYCEHSNLTDATRFLANELFKDYGLVIVDGNDLELKKALIPIAKKELEKKISYTEITKTTANLAALGYKQQVQPREINLFYLENKVRERIIEKDGRFFINNTKISYSIEEIFKLLDKHPEKFSPNAILRPLYQELILPNLCYIGGGGELAYWFQLKDYFKAVDVPYPILLLRNSALLVSKKENQKLEKLDVEPGTLFKSPEEVKTTYIENNLGVKIDFSEQRTHLKKQFEALYKLAEQTDASFVGAVGAQEKKQLNGLDKLEKRLLRAEKRKHVDRLDRLMEIQKKLFPDGGLQERSMNFSQFYLQYGPDLLKIIKENLDPLSNDFTIIDI